jgi:hypothetical protein
MLAVGAIIGVLIAREGGEPVGPPIALKSGWALHTQRSDGFRIGLPGEWKPVPTTSADAAFNALKDQNPGLAAMVRDQLGGNLSALIRFIAFDVRSPTLSQNFATNMNVVLTPLPGGTNFDRFVDLNLQQLRQVPGLSETIATQRVQLPAGEAAIITSRLDINTAAGTQSAAITQYLLQRGDSGYILSFTTLPANLSTYAPLFEEVARTFRYV